MNNQELRHRIEAVKSTVKITRAMQVIAASKLNRSQLTATASYEYLQAFEKLIPGVFAGQFSHPFARQDTGGSPALLVIASDKGLCGDYNHTILSFADGFIAENNIGTVYAIGYESLSHYKNRGGVNNAYVHIQEPHVFDATVIAQDLTDAYRNDEISDVYIAYTQTPTPAKQKPTVKKLLPVEIPSELPYDGTAIEPDTPESVDSFFFSLLVARIYNALADSQLAVNYKRMVSMSESTDNGQALIESLTKQYNHHRQESITDELINSASNTRRTLR